MVGESDVHTTENLQSGGLPSDLQDRQDRLRRVLPNQGMTTPWTATLSISGFPAVNSRLDRLF